jgi:hypothetical protein
LTEIHFFYESAPVVVCASGNEVAKERPQLEARDLDRALLPLSDLAERITNGDGMPGVNHRRQDRPRSASITLGERDQSLESVARFVAFSNG